MADRAARGDDKTRMQALMESMFLTALSRNHRDSARMTELILHYTLGKPREKIELSGSVDSRAVSFDLSFLSVEQAMKMREQIVAANQRLIDVEPEEPEK